MKNTAINILKNSINRIVFAFLFFFLIFLLISPSQVSAQLIPTCVSFGPGCAPQWYVTAGGRCDGCFGYCPTGQCCCQSSGYPWCCNTAGYRTPANCGCPPPGSSCCPIDYPILCNNALGQPGCYSTSQGCTSCNGSLCAAEGREPYVDTGAGSFPCCSPYVSKADYDSDGNFCCSGTSCGHDYTCYANGTFSGSYRCSSGTWVLSNAPPTISSATDSPDPVIGENPITFTVSWSDPNSGNSIRVHVCQTNSISGQTCQGGTWCESAQSYSSPLQCYHNTSIYEAGTRNYYAFACDNYDACSAAYLGTFTVITPPIISSVTDLPDPVTAGNQITFNVNWSDPSPVEQARIHICRTNAISGQTCTGGNWCETASFLASYLPAQCSYTTLSGDAGTQNYYAFACDNYDACSAAVTGTFTVNAAPPQCTPNGCGDGCPSGCTVTQDPDCACQGGNNCCPSGSGAPSCTNANDSDCVAACTPNWQCDAWSPAQSTITCGQSFTQNRTCTDLNSCGASNGRPATSQSSAGTQCVSGTCQNGSCSMVIQCLGSEVDTSNLKIYQVGNRYVAYDGLVPCGKCSLVDVSVDSEGNYQNGGVPTDIPCQLCHIFVMIKGIVDFILLRMVPIIAVLLLTFGGIMYVVSKGDPGKLTQAKSILTATAVGLVITLASWLVINTIFTFPGIFNLNFGWDPARWFEVNCNITLPS